MPPTRERSHHPLQLSVIVPFHNNSAELRQGLAAVRRAAEALPEGVALAEIIVVADGAREDCRPLAAEAGAEVLAIDGPRGPAVARSRGAEIASGDVLVFVDTDVVVDASSLARFAAIFAAYPDAGAAFGAYDEDPADPGFISQCRNLAHSFIHQRASREATTFWAGLGAVRAHAFAAVGGFDERFTRPSVEDIDLGYRLRAAGYRILLDPTIRGKHLKRWSLWSGLRTDLRDRGVPWTQLLHRYAAMRDDLNVSRAYRMCVIVSYLALGMLLGAFWRPVLLLPGLACLIALVWLDRTYYAFFVRRRGLLFTLRWYPLHVMHHLSNGMSFGIGTGLFFLSRLGIDCPGALPVDSWSKGVVSTRVATRAG